jgi:hypothetical protein
MDPILEQPEVPDTASPLVIERDRVSEQHVESVGDGPSELELHKQARAKATEIPAQPAVEQTEQVAEPQAPEEPKKPERWKDPETGDTYDMRHKVARRIKQVLEKAAKAEERAQKAEAERERFMAAALEGRTRPQEPVKPVVDANAEPDHTDTTKYPEGQYDRAYVRDMALWAADQKANALGQHLRTERVQEQRTAAEDRVIAQWQRTALPEAQKRYPDFGDKLAMFPNTPEHEPIKEMMFGSPVGNDVIYAVGANPQLFEAYSKAPNERSRVRLLAHVEAQILARRTKAPAAPRTTNAPAPIQPVHAGQGPSAPMDWSKDDPDQYQRWKQARNQRR